MLLAMLNLIKLAMLNLINVSDNVTVTDNVKFDKCY